MGSEQVTGIRTVETFWIPLSDGRRLAARLFLPEKASAENPVPLVLEYIPYRRRDGTRLGDEEMHLWFAAGGYAAARIDIAGTGDSDGILEDEYVRREQDDALQVLDFLCDLPWCTGEAAMIGISWGGFSALQVAARRPRQLKAIVTICSTDDRYGCDAHYNGGLLINDNFGWGGAMFSYGALPPDPAVVGEERWRDLWKQRLDAQTLYPATWLRHQRRDDYWKHGSVSQDYSAIACPVLAVGGYLDGYTQTIFRLVENLAAPCKGLCGPWGHKEPQSGFPGPAIDFLSECLRWFDRWLKHVPNGAELEPAMRLWLMDDIKPAANLQVRPGRWLGFPDWPSPHIAGKTLHLHGSGALAAKTSQPVLRSFHSPLTTGLRGQEWCPFGQGRIAAEGAMDQREDDAGSLCFDTEPLGEALPLVGEARVTLRIAANQSQAMVAARLTSVAPDGTSSLITFGLLNLSHRKSHEHPEPMKPGAFETVLIVLKPVGLSVAAGHRLRLAVSTSYWPMAWPSPEPVSLTIDTGGSGIELPVLNSETGLSSVSFGPARWAKHGPVSVAEPARQHRSITLDVPSGETTLSVLSNDGRYTIEEIGTEVTSWRRKVYSIGRDDPASCRSTVTCHEGFRRADWHARVESEIGVTTVATHFNIEGWLEAYDGDTLFARRTYRDRIPRDHL